MEDLPDDILSNIFVRLRARQLAQMRCISKPWNALLSGSSLVKSHLDRSVHNNDGVLLVFSNLLEQLTVCPSRSPHMELNNFIKLPFNTQQSNHGHGAVIGSVNGLICFSYGSDNEFEVIHIWNPSLSAVSTLPPYSKSSHVDGCITTNHFRFGFDPKSDDYKVVKFTLRIAVDGLEFKNNEYFVARKCLQVEVYSMRKGSWKSITQKIPLNLKSIHDDDLMYLDGHHPHLHWLATSDFGGESIEVVVAFDLGTDTFCEIPLPDSIHTDYALSNNVLGLLGGKPCGKSNYLGVLGGKLCVMSCNEDGECEVWVMEEYGVAESWVKHFVFPPFGCDFKPHGFTLHSEFIFKAESHGLALYDPIEAKIKPFRDEDNHWGCKVVDYVDSLVWVTPPKQRNSLTSLLKRCMHAFLGWFLVLFRKKEVKTVKLN